MLAIQQKVPTGLIVLLCSGYSNPIFAFSIGGTYVLLTKREVKMARYWPSSLFAFLQTETKSRSIKTQKENEANTQPS